LLSWFLPLHLVLFHSLLCGLSLHFLVSFSLCDSVSLTLPFLSLPPPLFVSISC
jgi:hypothetical protein